MPDVVVTCDQELTIYEEEKNAVFAWIFEVQSKVVNVVLILFKRAPVEYMGGKTGENEME